MTALESDLLDDWAARATAAPDVPAVVDAGGALSRGELLEHAYGAAARCRPGERIRVAGDDVRVWLSWLAGSALAGGVLEFTEDGTRELPGCGVRPRKIVPETAPWLAVRTSGTTGHSRRLIRDQAAWLRCAQVEAQRLTLTSADRILALGQPAFSLMPYAATVALRLGAAFGVAGATRHAAMRDVFARLAPSVVYGAPPLVAALARRCRSDQAGSGVRRIITGGARLTPAQMEDMRRAWPSAGIATFYGTAEASLIAVNEQPDPHDPADVGTLFGDVEAHCDRNGRLRIRTPYAALGLEDRYGRTQSLADGAGWITLADRAELTADSRIRLIGRDDGCINLAGALVDPASSERALERLDWVAEAAVIGTAEARRSTAATAVLIPVAAPPADASRQVRQALRTESPDLPIMRVVCLDAEPPRTAGGKLDRRALARRYAEAAR